jgi:hypothetical protein
VFRVLDICSTLLHERDLYSLLRPRSIRDTERSIGLRAASRRSSISRKHFAVSQVINPIACTCPHRTVPLLRIHRRRELDDLSTLSGE